MFNRGFVWGNGNGGGVSNREVDTVLHRWTASNQIGFDFTTGQILNLAIDISNATSIRFTFAERLGLFRQFSDILLIKSGIKGVLLTNPYDTWHVNSEVLSLSTGSIKFSQENMNATLLEVVVYERKLI